jgi:endoglycosylceramidase
MRPAARLFLLLMAASSAACRPPPSAPTHPRLRAKAGRIYDAGQVLYLRGMNLAGAAKRSPDHLVELDEATLEVLREAGVNAIRLLVFWNAISPEGPAEVDQPYLEGVASRVARLHAAGLRVILDLHQDLWGEPFSPHGAPAWACPEETSAGYRPQSPWWTNYGSEQVSGCFDHFWADTSLQDALAGAWAALAEVTCDDAVIGFDLLNEPWPGADLADPAFDREVLWPFYERVAARIDEVCPQRLYFLEPSLGVALGLVDPFEAPPPSHPLAGRLVAAPHFYPNEVHEPDGPGYDLDAAALDARLGRTIDPFVESGVPVWVGEWGGQTTQATFGAYVADLGHLLMARGVGFALWDFGRSEGGFLFLDASGRRKAAFDGLFALPSPTRLPGPGTLESDPAAGTVRVETTCAAGRELEIRLPADACACEAPSGALGPATATDRSGVLPAPRGSVALRCTGEGSAQVRCRCPRSP